MPKVKHGITKCLSPLVGDSRLSQRNNGTSASKMAGTSFIWSAAPKRRPENSSERQPRSFHLSWRMYKAATAVAKEGISNMQDELRSRKPGEAIRKAAANTPTQPPLNL